MSGNIGDNGYAPPGTPPEQLDRVAAGPGLDRLDPHAPPHHDKGEGSTLVPEVDLQLHHDDLRHRFEAPGHNQKVASSSELTISTAAALAQRRHLPESSPSHSPLPTSSNLFVAQPHPPLSRSVRSPPSPSPHFDRTFSSSPSHISPQNPSSDPIPVSTNISQQHRSVRDLVQEEQAPNPSTSESSPIPSGHSSPTPDSFLPKSRKPKSLRPFITAIMAFEKGRKFSTGTSVHRKRQMSTLVEKEGHFGPALTVCANSFFEHAPFPPQVLLHLVTYDQRSRGLAFRSATGS